MVVNVAKPIQYVVELDIEDARKFVAELHSSNPARDKTVETARKTQFNMR